ncbi:MAG: DNA-binding protein WhiA [Lachnospiraceae bacterium]|nr:DNA-binding protein WhiA [Lachnospiraceae bacterium]MBR6664340.1 DNA-binding protein WhiA [Lachnospiraceae bacterium]
MSFSYEVKEELAKHLGAARHCQMAELAAMLHFCGQYGRDSEGAFTIGFQVENPIVVKKCFTLLKKTFSIDTDATIDEAKMNELYRKFGDLQEPADELLLKSTCCRRAFIRGAFLAIGSVSAPEKGYHLEFVTANEKKAKQLQGVIQSFDIDAKIVLRKKYHVLYMKESEAIVDLLNVMEAHIALMKLENLRILKELRNTVNRRVNCETANINKTLDSSRKQQEDIRLLQEKYGLENLPKGLQQIARMRLEEPEASLKELGEMLEPPIGKSGVNHRLRKLSEMADKLKLGKEEE